MFKSIGKVVETCVKAVLKTGLTHNTKTTQFINSRIVHQPINKFYDQFSTPNQSVMGDLYTKSTGFIMNNYLNIKEY